MNEPVLSTEIAGEAPRATSGPSRPLRRSAGKRNQTCSGPESIPRRAVGLGETYYLPGAVERVVHDLAAPTFPRGAGRAPFPSCGRPFSLARTSLGLPGRKCAPFRAGYGFVGRPRPSGRTTRLPAARRRLPDMVPAYNTCVNAGTDHDWDRALEEPAALAAELRDLGYFGMKVWPWDRFAPQLHPRGSTGPAGWSAMGPVGSYLSQTDLATGLSVLEAARDRVGTELRVAAGRAQPLGRQYGRSGSAGPSNR